MSNPLVDLAARMREDLERRREELERRAPPAPPAPLTPWDPKRLAPRHRKHLARAFVAYQHENAGRFARGDRLYRGDRITLHEPPLSADEAAAIGDRFVRRVDSADDRAAAMRLYALRFAFDYDDMRKVDKLFEALAPGRTLPDDERAAIRELTGIMQRIRDGAQTRAAARKAARKAERTAWAVEWKKPISKEPKQASDPYEAGRTWEIYQSGLSRRGADRLAGDVYGTISPRWFGINAETRVVRATVEPAT